MLLATVVHLDREQFEGFRILHLEFQLSSIKFVQNTSSSPQHRTLSPNLTDSNRNGPQKQGF